MSRRLPWRTDDRFPVDVRVVRVDGEAVSAAVDSDARRVDLSTADGWMNVAIGVEASPNGEAAVEPDAASIHVAVPRTRARLAAPMDRSGSGWRGTIELSRDEVQGRGSLDIRLHGVVNGEPHRLLGASSTWAIDFDERPQSTHEAPSPIPVVWESFKEPEQGPPALRALRSSTHYLDFGPEPPCLYLNTDVEKLRQLLQWDTAQSWKRDLRDALSADLAAKVLAAMAHASFAEIYREDDGATSGPARPSLVAAFEKLAAEMEGVADADELREKVLEAREDSGAYQTVLSTMGSAIDALVEAVPNAERFAGRVFE